MGGQKLDDAIVDVLGAGAADKDSIRRQLLTRDFNGPRDTSSINSVLYRMEREGRVRHMPAQPPVWQLVDADGRPVSDAVHSRSARTGRQSQGASDSSAAVPARSLLDTWRLQVWQAAIAAMTDGDDHDVERLARSIAEETRIPSGVIRRHLLEEFRGVTRNDHSVRLRHEFMLRLVVRSRLPGLLVTPAGNVRHGSVTIDASGARGHFSARVEVLDDSSPFWLFVRVDDPTMWRRLASGAESLTSGWALPLLPAPRVTELPAVLVWPRTDPTAVVALIDQIAITARLPAYQWVNVAAEVPDSQDAESPQSPEDAEIRRLVLRRGSIPKGRRYPIAGACDRCGQPLSDPYSLLVGIGPVCRRYYVPRVLRKVAQSIDGGIEGSPSGGSPVDAVLRVAAAWRPATIGA